MKMFNLCFLLLGVFLYGCTEARVAQTSMTEDDAKAWGATEDGKAATAAGNSMLSGLDQTAWAEEEIQQCENEKDCPDVTAITEELRASENQMTVRGKGSFYWVPWWPRQCCYTRRYYVAPYTVYGYRPATNSYGTWYAVHQPWLSTHSHQILDYVYCRQGSCWNTCRQEYRYHSVLVSTFQINTFWQFVWGTWTGNVFWTYVRVPAGCYCPTMIKG